MSKKHQYRYINLLFKKYEHKEHPIHKDYILFTNGEIVKRYYGYKPQSKWNRSQIATKMFPAYNLLKQTERNTLRCGKKEIYTFITINGIPKYTHVLMAETFLNHNHKKTGLVVDHINNNSTDNRLQNLQLITSVLNKLKDSTYNNQQYKYNRLKFTQENSILTEKNKINSRILVSNKYKLKSKLRIKWKNQINKS